MKTGGISNGKERKRQIGKRGMSGTAVIILILIILVFVTSTQKVEINDKKINTATPTSCKLIKEVYDPMQKICVPAGQQLQNSTKNGTQGGY